MASSLLQAQGQPAQSQVEQIIEKGYRVVKEGAIERIQKFLLTGDTKVSFSNKEYVQYYQ